MEKIIQRGYAMQNFLLIEERTSEYWECHMMLVIMVHKWGRENAQQQ
jgi:hypothetical protein